MVGFAGGFLILGGSCGFFIGYWESVHVYLGPRVMGPDVSPCGLCVCAYIDEIHDIKL